MPHIVFVAFNGAVEAIGEVNASAVIEAVVGAFWDEDGVGGVAGTVFSVGAGPGADAFALGEGAGGGGAPLAVHVAGLGFSEAFVAV